MVIVFPSEARASMKTIEERLGISGGRGEKLLCSAKARNWSQALPNSVLSFVDHHGQLFLAAINLRQQCLFLPMFAE